MEISLRFSREKREAYPQSSLSNFVKWLASGVWGKKTSSGEVVDEESALKLSAVWACVRILSETVASLPFDIYRQTPEGKFKATDHRLYRLIHDEPNPFMTSMVYRETLMTHLALWGNHYSEIIRNGGYIPIQLNILHPSTVEPYLTDTGKLRYKILQTPSTKERIIDPENMLHIPGLSFDGIKGKSPIEVAAENIGLGLALQKFGAEFFLNGASLSATLTHPGKLSEPAYERLKKSLNEEHTGEGNRHKIQIFEEGMKWDQQVMPLEQAQFILSRKFQLNEIARMFRIPPHMLADLERSTNNNIEHQGIEFVQHTILPWCIRIEQEFNRKLFTEAEKRNGVSYVKFNLNGLLRGDAASRATYYNQMFQIGTLNQNEIRELEDRNGIGPEGDKYYVMQNLGNTNTDDNGTGKEDIPDQTGDQDGPGNEG